jgi:uncharacterized protein YggE
MKETLFKKLLMLSASVFLSVLTVLAIVIAISPSWHENLRAQIINEPFSKSITVTAEGKITATPDIAIVNLAVVSQAKNVKQAVEDGNSKMTEVYNAVKELNVSEKDISSTSYNLYPNYDYSKSYSSPRITGYTLDQQIQVKIRDLEKIEDVLDRAVSAGSNQIGQLTFDIDDPSEIKKQVREKAFDTARLKAEEMADAAGVSLGEVLTFSEGSDYAVTARYANYKMDATMDYEESASVPTIAPGSKDFSINVSITYSIN